MMHRERFDRATRRLARVGFVPILWAGVASAQETATVQLDYGPSGVGFRVIEALDSSRAFSPKRDWRGRRGGETARPVQVGLWYPAARMPAAEAMRAGEFRVLRESELDFRPRGGAETTRLRSAFIEAAVRAGITAERAAALWDDRTPAVRDAPPLPGRHPTVLYFTAAGVSNALLPAYLASHGFVVATFPSNGRMTEVALEFTPNALTLDTDVDDAGFVHALLRRLRFTDPERLALYSFSSGSLAALLWQMRDIQADALVAVEGWERYRRGADIVRRSVHYDATRVRVPFLMIERAAAETSPAYTKVPDVVESLHYADVLRVAFRDAAHGDFLSHVTTGQTPEQARIYATAARMTRLFLQANLLGDDEARAVLAALRPPAADPFFTRAHYAALPAAPTEEELYRMAELDADSAARAYRQAREGRPGVLLFREHVLTRAATFAGSPESRATIMALVIDSYPQSVAARWSLGAAYRDGDRDRRAASQLRAALDLVDRDPSLEPADRDAWRARIREALGTPRER